ncbi:DUF6777 domain-containing protein [Streptomyces sp. GC420]|uniref:DUF6777 domain-containing protein n=1 Tax=Streptomyces sp. GC420 TaxID=2697568 RepID=UPI0028BD7902|nr:DUF6777 domain-containing protein [Streptomyces sp. GC420]
MTSQPPSGRPAGPPSGPLSGSSSGAGRTPPPPGPPRPSGAGPNGGEPRRPWWRDVPKIAAVAAAVIAAVVLAVVLTRPDGGGEAAAGEVFLQPASETGPDPFTGSTVTEPPAAESPETPPTAPETATGATRSVPGSTPGLYGGTQKVASCDVEKQIGFLTADAAKTRAFATVLGIDPSTVPAYLRSLTPLQLMVDTRVTNHGYRDGSATSYQAVLQRGTAVLVDGRGEPRVRCACGNPLTRPVEQKGAVRTTGEAWAGFRASDVVVVAPAEEVVDVFVVHDPEEDHWFVRKRGDTGKEDRKTAPPKASLSPSDPHSDRRTGSPSDERSESPSKSPSDERSEKPSSESPSGERSDKPSEEPSDKRSGERSEPERSEPPSKPAPSPPEENGEPEIPVEPEQSAPPDSQGSQPAPDQSAPQPSG